MIHDRAQVTEPTSIPPDILALVGSVIFGRQWQTPLARSLNVSDRTVRRWAAAGAPPFVKERLRELIDVRYAALDYAVQQLVPPPKPLTA